MYTNYDGLIPNFLLYIEGQRKLQPTAKGGRSGVVKDFMDVMESDTELESGHLSRWARYWEN